MSCKIGNVTLSGNLFLAPLAGFSDIAFRRLCREEGAALTTGEMASVKGLYYNNEMTELLLKLHSDEKPSCIQLFGSDPEFFERAIALKSVQKADIIDINMGCPMPKIMKNGDGAALGANIGLAAKVAETVKKSGKPVTAKIRLGLDYDKLNTVELSRALLDSGVDAITVHGRTAAQGYTGFADYEKIGDVAAKVTGKIICNGDITSRADADEKIEKYKFFGAAIGRGAVGNPYIFNKTAIEPTKEQTLKTILRHIDYMLEDFPPRHVVVNMRKHICAYLDNLKGYKKLKNEVNLINDVEGLKALLKESLN